MKIIMKKISHLSTISGVIVFAFIIPQFTFASSCSKIGNSTYCDDGTSYSQIGNTIYSSDGTSYSQIGNTTYGSDGSSYSRIGNTTYSNDGTSYSQIGNTTYGSDGSSYSRIGNTTYGTGGNVYSSCPTNSSYDSLSGKCKCSSGYIVSGSSCIYDYSYQTTPTCPINSSYDSLSSECKCYSGYIVKNGSCVSANSYCYSNYGYGSSYDSISKTCKCDPGYEYDGSSCVYKSTSSNYPSTYPTNSYSCPLNSSQSPTDSSKCQCNTGYQVDSTKTSCVKVTETRSQATPINSYADLTSDERCVMLNFGTFYNTDTLNCDTCPLGTTRISGTNTCQKPIPVAKKKPKEVQVVSVTKSPEVKRVLPSEVVTTSQATTTPASNATSPKKSPWRVVIDWFKWW